jgi:hypothetical protein
MQRTGRYGANWQIWSELADMERTGRYGANWQTWSELADMERTGRYGANWQTCSELNQKTNFALEQAMKTCRGSGVTAVLFL